jgi:hypothetical protein
MNESIAKKLGEVLAFTRVGTDTIEKGRPALSNTLGEEQVLDMLEKFRIHGEEIMRNATDAAMIDTVLEKAEKTETKVKEMRDLYIADKWDNATEIMEWNGFFIGAAIVHWAFVKGAAQGMNHENLMTLSEEGVNWNYELLEKMEGELESKGQDKATA